MHSTMRVALRRGRCSALLVLALSAAAACAPARGLPAQPPQPPQPPLGVRTGSAGDTLDPNYVPPGYGSLKQDDIAVKLAPSNGLQVRAIPLDERLLRLLSPDSYRSLRELPLGKQRALDAVRERVRLPSYSIWYVSFYALEQGETRFSPGELIISNVGRDFRPLDVVPLSTGFGEYRLKQREVQSALMVFDGQLDINQPLTAQMEGSTSLTNWNDVLQKVERERALVRSRAAAKTSGTDTLSGSASAPRRN